MYTNTSNTTDVVATDVVVATFTTATAIAFLPTLLLLGRAGWSRLRRGADAEPSV